MQRDEASVVSIRALYVNSSILLPSIGTSRKKLQGRMKKEFVLGRKMFLKKLTMEM